MVLDQALIVKAIEAGISNGTWVCHDGASGTTLTREQSHGPVRIAADVMLYSVERAKELGVIPLAAPPVEGGGDGGQAPEGGSVGAVGEGTETEVDSEPHDGPMARLIEAHGSAGVALNKLNDQIGDLGARALTRISVRVAPEVGQGAQPFRILGHCVAQLARFGLTLKLSATAEFRGIQGAVTLDCEGPARDCVSAFEALYTALDQASDVAGNLTLTLTQNDAISCAGQDFSHLQEVFKRAQPGHVAIEAEIADAN